MNFCDKCKEGAVEVCKVRMHKIYCITEDIRKYLLKIEFLRRAYEKETRLVFHLESCVYTRDLNVLIYFFKYLEQGRILACSTR